MIFFEKKGLDFHRIVDEATTPWNSYMKDGAIGKLLEGPNAEGRAERGAKIIAANDCAAQIFDRVAAEGLCGERDLDPDLVVMEGRWIGRFEPGLEVAGANGAIRNG